MSRADPVKLRELAQSNLVNRTERHMYLIGKTLTPVFFGDEIESPKLGHRPIVSNMTTGTQIQVSLLSESMSFKRTINVF